MTIVKNKILFLLLLLTAGPIQARAVPASDLLYEKLNGFSYEEVTVELQRGSFTLLRYAARLDPSLKRPKGLILFESGSGGWCWWEDKVCLNLSKDGYEILGIDARLYSLTDFDVNVLQQDFQTIAQSGLKPYGAHPLPLIVGGWSAGAEQAVAVGGGPHPPSGLVGLLLIAPGSWGGYGWFTSHDYGPRLVRKGTFALADFAQNLSHLRIVQWHAAYDIFDSRSWLDSLTAPHREYDMDSAIHDFGCASPEFLAGLDDCLTWLVNGDAGAPPPAKILGIHQTES